MSEITELPPWVTNPQHPYDFPESQTGLREISTGEDHENRERHDIGEPPALLTHATVTGEFAVLAEGLTKQYKDGKLAVNNLSLKVERGQIFGLLGPNGAGKTTTIRMLLGLIRPTGGKAFMLGSEIRPSAPVLSKVGILVDSAGYVPFLSGRENLRLWWESAGRKWSDIDKGVLDYALEFAGLGGQLDRKVKAYSQGMKQRLGLAQALLNEPELLILDEPTNGLDPKQMRAVRDLIEEVGNRGTTVLLSSHILSEIEQVCSHAAVINQGRLIKSGTVAELIGNTSSSFFEVDDIATSQMLLDRLPGIKSYRVAPDHSGIEVETDGVSRGEIVKELVLSGVIVETAAPRNKLEDAYLGLVDNLSGESAKGESVEALPYSADSIVDGQAGLDRQVVR